MCFRITKCSRSFGVNGISFEYINLFIKNRKDTYDVAIAFSGHMNDLTFVAENFIKSKKSIAWLHGALYGYMLSSTGYFILYAIIKN